MTTRRSFCALMGGALAATALPAGPAFACSGAGTPVIKRYALTPPHWPHGLHLRIAVLADIHPGEPWVGLDDLESLVARTNALEPDVIVMLGDYVGDADLVPQQLAWQQLGDVLGGLRAPLGVHAVLGNHDWWEDPEALARLRGPTNSHRALERAGIQIYDNLARRLSKNGRRFWIAGLANQQALLPAFGWDRSVPHGLDDLPGTLAQVRGDDPVLLLMHEPYLFTQVPDRVALTLAGHTHGGQLFPFGLSHFAPSDQGRGFTYGHIEREGRHMIISGGLGCSIVPLRLFVPPEIVVVELGPPG